MSFELILFYLFSFVLLIAALGVITVKNSVHAALLLVLTFFTAAALWLLLQAEFLAVALVLVYVGAVMVLFLFVVMMLDVNIEELRRGLASYWPMAAAVAGFVAIAILNVIVVRKLGGATLLDASHVVLPASNTRALGEVLFTRFAYPAQLAAVVLLVASVAAIVLTLRSRKGAKQLDVAAQVAVRAQDRLRMVKMPGGRRS